MWEFFLIYRLVKSWKCVWGAKIRQYKILLFNSTLSKYKQIEIWKNNLESTELLLFEIFDLMDNVSVEIEERTKI